MAEYTPLYEWLMSKTNTGEEEVSLTFGEIEEILGDSLPPSARIYRQWWANDETHSQATKGWMAAGWKVGHADLNSEQVIFEQFGVPFIQPTGVSDSIEKSERYRITICPDACVLLQMVKASSGLSSIGQIDKWLRQMNQCKVLLSRDNVDWVIPEQVTRELDKNRKHEFSVIKKFKDDLTSKENIVNEKLDLANDELSDAVSELEKLARQNQRRIIAGSLILPEKNGDYRQGNFINEAWSFVHDDKFPNQEKQQMKDSVILSHLLALSRENDGVVSSNFPIYFWTFDKFDNAPNSRFPKEASREFIEIISDIDSISYPQTIVS